MLNDHIITDPAISMVHLHWPVGIGAEKGLSVIRLFEILTIIAFAVL